jgi:sigma-E factor negative regulatory protein RseC
MSLNKINDNLSNNNKKANNNKNEAHMIEETAVVVNASQGYAWVRPEKSSGCGSCSSKSSCSSTSTLSLFKKDENVLKKVVNSVHAKPGDKVVIGLESGDLLKSSLLAYILPLVSLILFAIAGQFFFSQLNYNAEIGAMLFGVAGLFAGFGFADMLVHRFSAKKDFEPVILRLQDDAPHIVEFMPAALGK